MNTNPSKLAFTLLAVGLMALGTAHAAQTTARANVNIQGYDPIIQSLTGTEAITASAGQFGYLGAGEVFLAASASAAPGVLRAAASSRGATTGGSATDIPANAGSSWSDSFRIQSAGRDGQTGIWTGSVLLDGGLFVEFGGRATAMAGIYASMDTFTGTGDNGGRIHVEGSAELWRSYEPYSNFRRGNASDAFALVVRVPFTFNQNIDISMSISAVSWARLIGEVYQYPGGPLLIENGSARSFSDYGHTMMWGGISEVLDSKGTVVTDYSARSITSNFDFASPVPEPKQPALLLAGLCLLAWLKHRNRQSAGA